MTNINLPLIAIFTFGIIHLVLSGLTIRRGVSDRGLGIALGAFNATIIFLVIIQGLLISSYRFGLNVNALYRWMFYAFLASAVFLYLLTSRYVRLVKKSITWLIIGALWIVGIAVLFENVLRLPDIIFSTSAFFVTRAYAAIGLSITGWGVFIFHSLLLLMVSYRTSVHPLHRNRLKYWFIVLVLYTFGSILLFFRQPLVGFLIYTLSSLTLIYCSLTLQLPDIRQIARRSSSFLINSLLSVIFYASIIWLLVFWKRIFSIFLPIVIAISTGILIALVVNPILSVIQRFIYKSVTGDHRNESDLLSEYSKNIANILDLNRLASKISEIITEAIDSKQVKLIMIEQSSGEENIALSTVRDDTTSEKSVLVGIFSSHSPIIAALGRERLPLTQYDIDLAPRFRDADPEEKRIFSDLQMDVFIPIYLQDRWIGILALGPKYSGDRFFKHELATLEAIADQTAVALENARLYADLSQRNMENEKLNSQLTDANQELSRLDKAKSDFISIASHELRTPLTQILGYNDIMGDMVDSGSIPRSMGMQMVDGVRKAARRLEEIVDTMFDVSKLDTNTLELNKTTTSIPVVIAEVVNKWSKALIERKLSISVHGLSSLPTILADQSRMVQVFSHLLQNAIKATPDGGKIRILGDTINTDSEENRYVEIVVADTGIGISGDEIERIFEKFYRVGNVLLHSTGDTKFKGAGPGLGLTIARGIIEAHGGRIWAESPGYDENNLPGAKMYVLLPVNGQVADTSFLFTR
jgi:signal transduction histidine kinase